MDENNPICESMILLGPLKVQVRCIRAPHKDMPHRGASRGASVEWDAEGTVLSETVVPRG